jgi:hypothetical protein
MTTSLDTRTPSTHDRRSRRRFGIRLAAVAAGLAAAFGLAAVAAGGLPADRPGSTGSPFTEEVPALHGQTLAGYVADHEEARLPASP